jgi:hypothetical protein
MALQILAVAVAEALVAVVVLLQMVQMVALAL